MSSHTDPASTTSPAETTPQATTATTTTATTTTAATSATAAAAGDGAGDGTGDRTGARTAGAAEVITDARGRIDALDDRIIGLVQERMVVSSLIQQSRIASGGRRVNLSREMEVLGHYREALGKPGTTLAMTLLELCRGRI